VPRGRRKLGREPDWALSHPDGRCKRRAGALGKPESGFPLSHRRRRLDVRIKASWRKADAVSMVGGTSRSTMSEQRVHVPESWSSQPNSGAETSGARAPPRKISRLTTPSFLSMGHHAFNRNARANCEGTSPTGAESPLAQDPSATLRAGFAEGGVLGRPDL